VYRGLNQETFPGGKMRKVLFLAVLVMGLTVTGPFLVLGAPSAQAATCTIDPPD
jgi:hypothetical protein